ncbi:MAG: hypothetical protein ACK4SZ_05970 [Allosphingosinicella sp.]|uniref:hypothetical protein n=1 Tax=Allosphingosinicella sp. TaxID=2823234 RepID=UPI00395409C2
MDEREREVIREEPVVERNRTTVINTGERSGGGGLIAAVLLLIVLAVVAFLVFGDSLGGTDKTDIKVDVEAPDVDLPDVDLPAPGNQTK